MEEIKIWLARPDAAYPFPYLITRLCEADNVPVISGIDDEIHAKNTHNPISKNEIQLGLQLYQDVDSPADPPITKTVPAPDLGVQSSEARPPKLAYSVQADSVPQSDLTTSVPPAATGSAFQSIDIRKVARQRIGASCNFRPSPNNLLLL